MKGLKKIVIIGNGPGGNAAASIIRKYRSDVIITILSEESYPEYCNCFLADFISGKLGRKSLFLKSKRDYARDGINIYLGRRVYELDPARRRIMHDEGEEDYDKLIIATGSESIIPGIEGINLKGVFTIKSLRDAEGISEFGSKAAMVVGAGPIGVEVSIALRKRKMNVCLVEKEQWILSRLFDKRLAKILEDRMRLNGIEILAGTEIRKILGPGKVSAVLLEENNRIISCDMVIFAVGVRPNTGIAKHAEIELGKLGGIKTDEKMAVSVPDIYACGDCVESRDPLTNKAVINALWPNAVVGGKVAGLNAMSIVRKFLRPVNMNIVQIYGLSATSIGYSDFSLGGLKGSDFIEGSMLGGEYRVILHNGNLVGMQIIGMKDNLVPLVSMIYKHEKLSRVNNALISSEFIRGNPFYCLLLTSRNFLSVKDGGRQSV